MENVARPLFGTPKFTNVSKILAMNENKDREYLNIVRVLNKTANITNGSMIIRRFVDVPDGAYEVNADGSIRPVRYTHGFQYPDIELCRPPLEAIKPCCVMTKEDLARFIQVCQQASSLEGYMIIGPTGLYMKQNPNLNVVFPFGLDPAAPFNATYLEVTFIEMLQYPQVYMLREPVKYDQEKKPLIIGVDWGCCAVIAPLRNDVFEE